MVRRPHVLISNDDGVTAPGLVSLVDALIKANFADVTVVGPMGERSAQSQAINILHPLHAFRIDIPGTRDAWAVDGSPADSVMLAMSKALWEEGDPVEVAGRAHVTSGGSSGATPATTGERGSGSGAVGTGSYAGTWDFDLVISGINRGDNCGLHVHYSGTVGAAREAACKGVPAIAVSLANHQAREPSAFAESARVTVELARRVLFQDAERAADDGAVPLAGDTPLPLSAELPNPVLRHLGGVVINVNVPTCWPDAPPVGLAMARVGRACAMPKFVEKTITPEAADRYQASHGVARVRTFRNAKGWTAHEGRPWSDTGRVEANWVAVTPLALDTDLPFDRADALDRLDVAMIDGLEDVLAGTAAELGLEHERWGEGRAPCGRKGEEGVADVHFE